MYFDEEVQAAVVRYNSLDHIEDAAERNKLYQEKIAYAFDKLVENIINTFKFSYFDSRFNDVKNEVVSFLVLNMHKYNADKGFKAFSYFSVVVKNYLILNNNSNYKKMKMHYDVTAGSEKILKKSMSDIGEKHNREAIEEFLDNLIIHYDAKIENIFKKKEDINIAYSILSLLKNREQIENFNKKGIYILIREMTGVETSKITKVINIMKKHYSKAYSEFWRTGTLTN